MTKSRRRCCMCFALDQNLDQKRGQIAHLDRNPNNASFDNLAFLCLEHHDLYDARPSQIKGHNPEEVKEYRNALYAHFENLEPPYEPQSLPAFRPHAGFLIGSRLKALRSELGVSSSEFVELINMSSETEYLKLEKDKADCPNAIIQETHHAVGVSQEWLKHGRPPRFKVELLPWHKDPLKAANEIIDMQPRFVYLTVATPAQKSSFFPWRFIKKFYAQINNCYLHIGLLVQTQPYLYRIFDLNLSLALWDGFTRQDLLVPLIALMRSLIAQFQSFDFRVLPISSVRDELKLYAGNVHPAYIARKYWNHGGLASDIFNESKIYHDDRAANNLYGPWLPKFKEVCRNHL